TLPSSSRLRAEWRAVARICQDSKNSASRAAQPGCESGPRWHHGQVAAQPLPECLRQPKEQRNEETCSRTRGCGPANGDGAATRRTGGHCITLCDEHSWLQL